MCVGPPAGRLSTGASVGMMGPPVGWGIGGPTGSGKMESLPVGDGNRGPPGSDGLWCIPVGCGKERVGCTPVGWNR